MGILPLGKSQCTVYLLFSLYWLGILACSSPADYPSLPDAYQESGAFIKTLPYYNPDSCVLLIRRDVPQYWQGAAYENLFLGGPEDSPLELGFKHLDVYEKNFPADTASEFAQLWRGRLYTHLGKLDSARACLQASYESALRHKRYLRASDAQRKIAQIYHKEAKTAQALRAYLTVYDAIKNLDSTQTLRKCYCMKDISNAYVQAGNLREALAWLDRAAALVADENNQKFRAERIDIMGNYPVIYSKLNQPDSAIIMVQKALDLQEKYKTNNDRPDLLAKLGNAYLVKTACRTALRYFLEAQQTRRGNEPSTQSHLLSKLADSYRCVGRLDSAEILYKQALQSPALVTVANAQQGLSEVYARQGNFKAAFEATQAFLKIRNQVYSPEKMQEIANVKSELELERFERKTAEIRHGHRVAQLRMLLFSLLLLLASGALLGLFLRLRSRARILEQQKQLLEQHKALARLHAEALERTEAALKTAQTELDNAAHLLALKNQLVEQLQMRLQTPASTAMEVPGEAAEKAQLRRMKILNNTDWLRFREQFEALFPNLLGGLKTRYPDLTAAELRLFMLQKLQFDVTEISEALAISPGSVWQSRQRLTKKLGLSSTVEMELFIRTFNAQ